MKQTWIFLMLFSTLYASKAELPYKIQKALITSDKLITKSVLTKDEAIAANALVVFVIDDHKNIIDVTINTFELYIVEKGDTLKHLCTGNLITPEIKSRIDALSPGSQLYFANILGTELKENSNLGCGYVIYGIE